MTFLFHYQDVRAENQEEEEEEVMKEGKKLARGGIRVN